MEDTQDLSARLTKLQENVQQWEHRLQSGQAGPDAFRQMLGEFRSCLDDIGRSGFQRLAQACEMGDDTVVHHGEVYRFKQVVDKEWMTLWGKVVVGRRLYQRDRGGPSRVPLDERCGMVKRFMVPELERLTAFLGAGMVPAEVRDCLGELLPEPPSRTAIQQLLARVGQYAEDHADQPELALQEATCSTASPAFSTSTTPPSTCRRRPSISSASGRQKPIAGIDDGATNCAMSREPFRA